MKTRQKELIKQQEVLGGFDAANYQAEYLHVPARDGAMVPVSLVYRKGFEPDGTSPLLLYAYGSYGYSMDAGFRLEPAEPAGPGLRLRHRPRPRRPGDGPPVVRGRQAAQEEEHLHRLHRLRPLPGGQEVHLP